MKVRDGFQFVRKNKGEILSNLNDKQLEAVNTINGPVLILAGAGSGKTTVLVERVIQRLIDTSAPCPADKLVIVTFTRAAASEMKARFLKMTEAFLYM